MCTVTDFSADDKARGVKFYTVAHLPFWGTLLLRKLHQKPKIGRIGCVGNYCLGYISLPYRKRHATDAPIVEYRVACERRSACVDIRPSPMTDYLKLRAIYSKEQGDTQVIFPSLKTVTRRVVMSGRVCMSLGLNSDKSEISTSHSPTSFFNRR